MAKGTARKRTRDGTLDGRIADVVCEGEWDQVDPRWFELRTIFRRFFCLRGDAHHHKQKSGIQQTTSNKQSVPITRPKVGINLTDQSRPAHLWQEGDERRLLIQTAHEKAVANLFLAQHGIEQRAKHAGASVPSLGAPFRQIRGGSEVNTMYDREKRKERGDARLHPDRGSRNA